jgi:GNAT superfamily N-acetyltransferase
MTISTRLDFQQLTSADASPFTELWQIYVSSLPRREQKSRAQIATAVAHPQYRVWLAQRAGMVVGFSICFVPIEAPFFLLEYMAVAESCRNLGIGSDLLRYTISATAGQRPGLTMLVEVDSEREDSADRWIRRRRKDFYRRSGCRSIRGLAYILPLPGEGAPPEIDLMVRDPPPRSLLSKADLRTWLDRIFREVYGCLAEDPRIDRMLAPVADPVEFD